MSSPQEIKFESYCERVIKQKEREREKLNNTIAKVSGIFTVFAICLAIVFQSATLFILGGIAFMVLLSSLTGSYYDTGVSIFKAGLVGESRLRQRLREVLSEDYTVFYNYVTPYGDIDALVVGPSGVFVIEAKNHNGYVEVEENQWRRIKVGRGGTAYKADIGNPEYQAKKNALYIRDFLKQKGINVWVRYAVVMTNPEVKLKVRNNPNVFHIDELDKLFLKEKTLSNLMVEKIKTALD